MNMNTVHLLSGHKIKHFTFYQKNVILAEVQVKQEEKNENGIRLVLYVFNPF